MPGPTYTVEPYDIGTFLVTKKMRGGARIAYVVDVALNSCTCEAGMEYAKKNCRHRNLVAAYLKELNEWRNGTAEI